MLNTMQCLDRLNETDEILDAEPSYDVGYDLPITCDSCGKMFYDEAYEIIKDKEYCSDCVADVLYEIEKKIEQVVKDMNLNIKASEIVDMIDTKVRG